MDTFESLDNYAVPICPLDFGVDFAPEESMNTISNDTMPLDFEHISANGSSYSWCVVA